MSNRSFITVTKPPLEVFESGDVMASQEAMYEGATPGEYFDRTEYPEEGDMLTYYYEHAFPMKGEPYPSAVDAIQAPKKFIMATMRFVKHHFILSGVVLMLPKLILLPYVRSVLKYYCDEYINGVIRPHYLARKRYCRSCRELLRAGEKVIESYIASKIEKPGVFGRLFRSRAKSFWGGFRESMVTFLKAFVMTLQWDNSHRYRFQDVFGEIDKDAFMKNPAKEMRRLVIVQVSRERGWHDDKARYFVVGWVVRMVFFFKPAVRRLVVDFIREVDIDEVKLDEADEYHNLLRPDYDIHGWPIEDRQRRYIRIREAYLAENPGRLEKGMERRHQAVSFATLKSQLEREEGVPFMMFIVMPDGERSTIKMVETRFSIENPKLRDACRRILDGEGAHSKEDAGIADAGRSHAKGN